jgi:hypothetical protein
MDGNVSTNLVEAALPLIITPCEVKHGVWVPAVGRNLRMVVVGVKSHVGGESETRYRPDNGEMVGTVCPTHAT